MKLDSLTIFSINYDHKINAHNVAFELSKEDYLKIAKDIMKNNEFQRNRIKRASSVYSLMKKDLKQGCLLPPIVLALDRSQEIFELLEKDDKKQIEKYIGQHYKTIKILDGLQRTNILIETEKELAESGEEKEAFYGAKLRFEMYMGANRFGILYRMLTLNTGQTPMSMRHQVEILYSDFYPEKMNKNKPSDIILLREKDTDKPLKKGLGKYKFNDMIDGFESYIQDSYLTLDRYDLLEYIKTVQKIESKEYSTDLFNKFVELYHLLVLKVVSLFKGIQYDKGYLTADEMLLFRELKPFGDTMEEIFTRSQPFTGFGAAISQVKFDDVLTKIESINLNQNQQVVFHRFVFELNRFVKKARSIGNAQRLFFYLFFQSLFSYSSEFSFEKALSITVSKLENEKI